MPISFAFYAFLFVCAMIMTIAAVPTAAVACGIRTKQLRVMLKVKQGLKHEKHLHRCGAPGGNPRRGHGPKQQGVGL
jgi:hypothetical protein